MAFVLLTAGAIYALPTAALYLALRRGQSGWCDRDDFAAAIRWPAFALLAIAFAWLGRDAGDI